MSMERRIKFDRERFGYVFAKLLGPVYLTDRDIICHLPSLTYYTLSLPHYMYYEVENPHESPEATVFYNINLKVDHIVFSVADMRGMYGEKASRIPFIVPAVDNTKMDIEKRSPYWASQREQTEEITDKHLVTLGKHQQQFLGSFKPKPNETDDACLEIPSADRKSAPSLSAVQNTESQQRDNSTSEERTELIQALIKSNGHLVDVAFLRRCIHEMAAKQKELYQRSQIDPDDTGDTPSSQPKRIKDKLQAKELDFENESYEKEQSNKQADIDRQIQLAMQ